MDSGTIEDSSEDFISRSLQTENYKVYTRRTKKRAHKSSNNNDTATTTCSTADLTSAVPSTSVANLTCSVSEVSSAVAVSEKPNCCDTASPPPATIHDNIEAASPDRTTGVHVLRRSPEAGVTKDGNSNQPPSQESVLQHGPFDQDADSFAQQLQEEMPSLLEGKNAAQNHVLQECGNQTTEEHTFVGEAKNSEEPPAVLTANESLQVSDDRPPSFGEESQLACGNDLPVGQEVTASDLTTGIGKDIVVGSTQVPEGHAPAITNEAATPLVISTVNDRIRICLQKATLKDDIKELRKKLELELTQVRRLVQQFESKEALLASYNTQISKSNLSTNSSYMGPESANIGQPQPQNSQIDMAKRRVLLRMSSEMNIMKHHITRPTGLARVNSDVGAARNLEPRPYSRQLSVALMENSDQGFEKEKRTPKANQYYRNSEFLLGKDRLPPENTKRFKSNNGRKHSRETGHTFGFGFDKIGSRLFKSCGKLLHRLMNHKFSWVFNEPVDAKALGLIDYHDIIKHPMDLGTIKTRLAEDWYKSPGEFAEDVRLVFRNAMTYNPKGQDVHHMAEKLLQIFEERWVTIETEYNPYWKYHQGGGLRTPPSRKTLPQSHLFKAASPIPVFLPATAPGRAYVPSSASIPLGSASKMWPSDRSEPMTTTMVVDPRIQRAHFGRTPVPKKPKAKDPNKRDMTYDEKQRLSTNLQGLPPEKLDAVVQIMQKRNTTVSQHGDEIEVDIDSVDTETLWELDRFITNYKKSLSKNKRKAELALQARMAVNQNIQLMNSIPAVSGAQLESQAATEKRTPPPAEGEKQGDDRSGSSSSNSSSSDSGSSSSDSDSESSSDGSDAEHSPRT